MEVYARASFVILRPIRKRQQAPTTHSVTAKPWYDDPAQACVVVAVESNRVMSPDPATRV